MDGQDGLQVQQLSGEKMAASELESDYSPTLGWFQSQLIGNGADKRGANQGGLFFYSPGGSKKYLNVENVVKVRAGLEAIETKVC